MHSDTLAIAISTYNRASVLSENLIKMLPSIKFHKIPIYISDDSDNDDTSILIQKLQQEYEFIFYKKNKLRLGHDENYIETLTWPKSKFVWYLGDSMYFKTGAIEFVIEAIDYNPNLIFTNSHAKRAKYETGTVKDALSFLIKTSWHLTLTGCSIYSDHFINWLKKNHSFVDKYPNFIQLGSIIEYHSAFSGTMYWIADVSVEPNKKKVSYWQQRAIEVFANDWVRAIEAVPLFTINQKQYIISSHARNTGLFGIKNLFSLRAHGAFSTAIYRKYQNEIKKAFYLPPPIAFLIALIPQSLAACLVFIVKAIRGHISTKAL